MNQSQPNNPLHGKTLKSVLEYLVEEYGWERLGERIKIKCFTSDPSLNSSLKFLRKTPWAREKVELLYTYSISYDARHGKKPSPADEPPGEDSIARLDAAKSESDSAGKPESPWDRARRKSQ